MTKVAGSELYKPALGELKPGEHPLPVPWEDDAVQLNVVVRQGISLAPLVVRIRSGAIAFSRERDRPFQIHDNMRPVGSPEQRSRTEVLAGPVSELALYSSATSEGAWRAAGEGLEIINEPGFNTFLALAFWGIYQQQNPDASIAEITSVFDKYPDL